MDKILYKSYTDYFRVGAAVSGLFYDEEGFAAKVKKYNANIKLPEGPFIDSEILSKHFNIVVSENDTKMGNMYPEPGKYYFDAADKFIQMAKQNNQDIRWHTLVWHNQSPEWIFKDDNGNQVSKEVLEQRLKDYIFTIGKRYAKDVCSVDVVNECISDKTFQLRNGSERSQWFEILGPEYIDKAFIWAKEAFPDANLVINDYNLEMIPGKREGMYNLVKGMLERGVPVDTVGLQMHINQEYPPVSMIEETIEMFGKLGLNVIVTEMDISVYQDYKDGKEQFEEKKELTPELMEAQAERYKEIFEGFKRQAKAGYLKDVLLWGITDRFTWKNHFPVPGRGDAPLLFDKEGKAKPAFDALVK